MADFKKTDTPQEQSRDPYWKRLLRHGGGCYDLSTGKQYLTGEFQPICQSGSHNVVDFGLKRTKKMEGDQVTYEETVCAAHIRISSDFTRISI